MNLDEELLEEAALLMGGGGGGGDGVGGDDTYGGGAFPSSSAATIAVLGVLAAALVLQLVLRWLSTTFLLVGRKRGKEEVELHKELVALLVEKQKHNSVEGFVRFSKLGRQCIAVEKEIEALKEKRVRAAAAALKRTPAQLTMAACRYGRYVLVGLVSALFWGLLLGRDGGSAARVGGGGGGGGTAGGGFVLGGAGGLDLGSLGLGSAAGSSSSAALSRLPSSGAWAATLWPLPQLLSMVRLSAADPAAGAVAVGPVVVSLSMTTAASVLLPVQTR